MWIWSISDLRLVLESERIFPAEIQELPFKFDMFMIVIVM